MQENDTLEPYKEEDGFHEEELPKPEYYQIMGGVLSALMLDKDKTLTAEKASEVFDIPLEVAERIYGKKQV